MSLIRPEVQQGLWRAREVIAAGAGLAVGLWLMALGGYLLIPLGGVLAALSLMLGLLAWRRLRFAKSGDGPGIVTVDEGRSRSSGRTPAGSSPCANWPSCALSPCAGWRIGACGRPMARPC